MKEEIKAIRVLPFSGIQSVWEKWSEKYQGIAAERGYLQVMLGKLNVPLDMLDIGQKVETNIYSQKMKGKRNIFQGNSIRKDKEIYNCLAPSWLLNTYHLQNRRSSQWISG